MTIIVSTPQKAAARNQCIADVAEMIEAAARSHEAVSHLRLAKEIVRSVTDSVASARREADIRAEPQVVEQIEDFGKNPEEYDPAAHSGNILAILRQAFDEEWAGAPIAPPAA